MCGRAREIDRSGVGRCELQRCAGIRLERIGHGELLPWRECTIGLLKPSPKCVGITYGAFVEHDACDIGRRDVDLVVAALRRTVDDELAGSCCSVGIPQLELLIANIAGIEIETMFDSATTCPGVAVL